MWSGGKDGGNFSRSEVENFKARGRKLDAKLSRYDTLQISELEKLLPENLNKVELARRELLDIYSTHHKDVTVIEKVTRIARESHVLIGSELARMARNMESFDADLAQLEAEFNAYWSLFEAHTHLLLNFIQEPQTQHKTKERGPATRKAERISNRVAWTDQLNEKSSTQIVRAPAKRLTVRVRIFLSIKRQENATFFWQSFDVRSTWN